MKLRKVCGGEGQGTTTSKDGQGFTANLTGKEFPKLKRTCYFSLAISPKQCLGIKKEFKGTSALEAS